MSSCHVPFSSYFLQYIALQIETLFLINVEISGAPQVLRHAATPEIVVEKGQNAEISLVVCADPRPRVVAWEWGSLRLEAGSEMGK